MYRTALPETHLLLEGSEDGEACHGRSRANGAKARRHRGPQAQVARNRTDNIGCMRMAVRCLSTVAGGKIVWGGSARSGGRADIACPAEARTALTTTVEGAEDGHTRRRGDKAN